MGNLPQGEPESPQKEENRIIPHLPANIADCTAEAHLLVPFHRVHVSLQWVHVRDQRVHVIE